MSGSGHKTFVDGDVLTAAEVNGYLMDQAVIYYLTSTARDLDTPYEGKIVYLADSNKMQFYTGTAWIDVQDTQIFNDKGDLVVGTGADTRLRLSVGTNEQRLVADSSETTGLKYVSDTTNYAIGAKGDLLVGTAADTVTNLAVGTNGYVLTADSAETSGVKWAAAAGGGSYVLVDSDTFTTVSSVTVDSCFTSTYRNYQIVINSVGSTSDALLCVLRASGSDITAGNYNWLYSYAENTSATIFSTSSQSSWRVANNQTVAFAYTIDIYSPQLSAATQFFSRGADNNNVATTPRLWTSSGNYSAATSADGFKIYPASGTITGTIRVYGLEN